ncbi:MAG: hypothetical protein V4722_16175 [Bacteroidota bacterium]
MTKVISYFQRWSAVRWVRLGFGALFVVPGIVQQELALVVIGSVFVLQAILNKGCSGDSCPLG